VAGLRERTRTGVAALVGGHSRLGATLAAAVAGSLRVVVAKRARAPWRFLSQCETVTNICLHQLTAADAASPVRRCTTPRRPPRPRNG
jgi:hypothetical protein